MAMTKRERAEAFTTLSSAFESIVGGPNPGDYAGLFATNEWIQTHPDLLTEFMAFMKALQAEVDQRFEETG